MNPITLLRLDKVLLVRRKPGVEHRIPQSYMITGQSVLP